MGKTEARSQKSETSIRTWEDAEEAMVAYAAVQNIIARDRAKMDAEILAITEKCSDSVGNAELAAQRLAQELEAFTREHKAEFETAPDGDGRSYTHAGVVIGFRKLLDKVALPRGDAKKEVALEYLVQYRPEFVRSTLEFDLIKLLAALKDGAADVVRALAEKAGITLKPGKDEFFLKITRNAER